MDSQRLVLTLRETYNPSSMSVHFPTHLGDPPKSPVGFSFFGMSWMARYLASALGMRLTNAGAKGLALVALFLSFVTSTPGADSQSKPNPDSTPGKSTQLSVGDIKALRTFGEKLANDISSANTNQVTQHIDVSALWNSVIQNLQAPEDVLNRMKLGFVDGMRRAPGGIFRNLLGKDVKFLRIRTRDGEAVALLRARLGDEGGATYLDVFTVRDAAGNYHVRDFYSQTVGEKMSTLSSRLLAKVIAAESKSPLATILKGNRADRAALDRTLAISDLLQKGQFREALDQSDTFPAELRKDRFVQFVRVQAATALKDEARQIQVLDEMAATFPNDPTFAFILLDRHFMKKEFTKALETVHVLMGDLGRDAFLSVLEGSCLSELHRTKDALNALEEGLKVEKNDRQLLWAKVNLLVKEKRYSELRDTLDEILKYHNQFADPRKAEAAGLSDFFASPEGVEYVSRLRKLGHVKSKAD